MINWENEHILQFKGMKIGDYEHTLSAEIVNGKFKRFSINHPAGKIFSMTELSAFLVFKETIDEVYKALKLDQETKESTEGRLVDIK